MASMYVHIPFCEHKCIYCDFYSITLHGQRGDQPQSIQQFLQALRQEIDLRRCDPFVLPDYDTVYFGGGTPSLLPPSGIQEILGWLGSAYRIVSEAEITLEVNPGTVDRERLAAFRNAGINRVSIGIQSFHDDDLAFLTRIHSSQQARECVRAVREAGFDNISIDLIFSLPGQTLRRWRENLEQAVALRPSHLSCYSLIVEPGTPLFRMVQSKQVQLIDTERDAELYEYTIEFLERHGYGQYEVSNFALPGKMSRHNSRYWDHSDYLGFGPSAHSFWIDRRWWNIPNLQTYCDRLGQGLPPVAGEESLSALQMMEESIFLGLRSEGLDLARFRHRFGRDLRKEFRDVIDRLVRDGLARIEKSHLRLTRKGYLLCDEICQTFR